MANAIDKIKSSAVNKVASKTGVSSGALNTIANKALTGSAPAGSVKSTSTTNKTSTSTSSNKNSVSTVGKTGASAAAIQAASQAATTKNTSTGSKSTSSSSGSGASSAASQAVNQSVAANTGASTAASNAVNQVANSKPTGIGTSTAGVNAGYTPKGTYNDAELRAAEQAAQIDYWKNQWNIAKAAGDTAGMQHAHAQAELIRAQQEYSGGPDGSQYIATPQNTPVSVWSSLPGASMQAAPTVTLNAYDQNTLSASDQALILQLKQDYLNAKTDEERKRINADAEAIRAKYGYSLGRDGNHFTILPQEQDMLSQIGLPVYDPQIDEVNAVYDRLNDASLSQLLASYNNSRANAEYQASKIPALYQQQRNATSADNEREKLAFREQAAASGLNAGNRSQANLAYSNQLQNSLGQLNTAEANALADANYDLTQLYNNYQQQIAQAVSENNYQRAAALLQEYQAAQESRVNTAVQQAQLNMQVADFNRTTRLNNIAQQNQDWSNRFNLATALADIGSYGSLGSMGNLSDADIQTLQRRFMVQQLGQYYPILRGYL